MTNKTRNRALFASHGCISKDAIFWYIKGDMLPEEIKLVNDHLESCSLCREAMEGARYFRGAEDFRKGITELTTKWNVKKGKAIYHSKRSFMGISSVAASVLLLVGIAWIILLQRDMRQEFLTEVVNRGTSLDTAIAQMDIRIISYNKENFIENDETARKDYVADIDNRESGIPVARINHAQVYAQNTDKEDFSSDLILNTDRGISRSHLSYPYVVMSRPPEHIELEMPEEEYTDDDLFIVVEEMPQFRDEGIQAFRKYVQENLEYPRVALENNISGRTYVQFTIDKSGNLTDMIVLKSIHSSFDQEVLRVIKNSPPWQPGKQRGKPVKVSMVIPVDFHLYK
ncbi:hypothetical protein ES705_31574 [subsurface metagenome]